MITIWYLIEFSNHCMRTDKSFNILEIRMTNAEGYELLRLYTTYMCITYDCVCLVTARIHARSITNNLNFYTTLNCCYIKLMSEN